MVLTTFTVLADVAQNVAGDKLQVESITKAGAEIHGYEPTPGDIRKASKADLILDNGLNLEAWFAQFVEGLDVPHAVVSEGVEVLSISEDSYQGKPNPHAWMSPVNVQLYVDNMVKAFSKLDPENAAVFEANGAAYKAKLQSVKDEMVQKLATVPEAQRALVTCEGAFSYLARDAGLREVYIWAVNAEQQATPQQITKAIEFVKANKRPGRLLRVHGLGRPDAPGGGGHGFGLRRRAVRGLALRVGRARPHVPGPHPARLQAHHRRPDGSGIMSNPAILVENVTVHYGEVLALDAASLVPATRPGSAAWWA